MIEPEISSQNMPHIEPDIEFNLSDSSDFSDSDELEVEKENDTNHNVSSTLVGRRIFNVELLFDSLSKIDHSPFDCNFSHFCFQKEIRNGLYSEFYFLCKLCGKTEIIKSDIPKPVGGMPINTAIVEGIICTGNGFSQLREICSTINMPCMSNSLFYKKISQLGGHLEDLAYEKMIEAGKEEKRLAVENNEVDDDGVPQITVVADGSWAKRSYKTNYNSHSGAACIIGYRTKKVLFCGVRNNTCSICAKGHSNTEINTVDAPQHKCYKNWSGSSTAMEADIIAEGFLRSIEMHGIKYSKLIGDGDSSVTSKLRMLMPYGPKTLITKIECKNHLLRNFSNKMNLLEKKTNNFKGFVPVMIRQKVSSNSMRLRKAIVGAINRRKCEEDVSQTLRTQNLRNDILNCASHVFGSHQKCADYFCKRKTDSTEVNYVPELKESGIWTDIQQHLSYLANNSESLILNLNNNYAEQFNSIIAKFVGGKRVNFTSRGSYQARCFGAVISFNTDAGTHQLLQKKITGCSPGKYLKSFTKTNQRDQKNSRKRKLVFAKNKNEKNESKRSCGPDRHYGLMELEDDLPPSIFENKKVTFLSDLYKDPAAIAELERKTLGQSGNNVWRVERRQRVTASVFGKICKMRINTSCLSTIKSMLYSDFAGSVATRYGRDSEPLAVSAFEAATDLIVENCGLFIDEAKCFLAASPDGIVGHDTIIEIKCPFTAANLTPTEAILSGKIKYCELREGKLFLKRKHDYFFQVQGQLHVTRRLFCYFVVWTPLGVMFERIERDDQFWQNKMDKPLETFYMECILPELVDPRYHRKMPLRERSTYCEKRPQA